MGKHGELDGHPDQQGVTISGMRVESGWVGVQSFSEGFWPGASTAWPLRTLSTPPACLGVGNHTSPLVWRKQRWGFLKGHFTKRMKRKK